MLSADARAEVERIATEAAERAAIGGVSSQGALEQVVKRVLDRYGLGPNAAGLIAAVIAPTYTLATQPAVTAVAAGTVVFVSDAAAGAKFQGSTGAAWVNLG